MNEFDPIDPHSLYDSSSSHVGPTFDKGLIQTIIIIAAICFPFMAAAGVAVVISWLK